MERPRYATLHPEGSYDTTEDVVNRLLLDSTQDVVFVLESLRGKVDPETFDAVRKALENIAIRSRHVGQRLIDVMTPRVQPPRK